CWPTRPELFAPLLPANPEHDREPRQDRAFGRKPRIRKETQLRVTDGRRCWCFSCVVFPCNVVSGHISSDDELRKERLRKGAGLLPYMVRNAVWRREQQGGWLQNVNARPPRKERAAC